MKTQHLQGYLDIPVIKYYSQAFRTQEGLALLKRLITWFCCNRCRRIYFQPIIFTQQQNESEAAVFQMYLLAATPFTLAETFATFLMMWEEKIDLLKKDFSPKEFHVHFTDWSDILKKIESKFIVKQDAAYFHTNWVNNIKGRRFVREFGAPTFLSSFDTLKDGQTYWFIAIMGDGPTSKQYVYSCNPKVLQSLASMATNDFFVVDKHLSWFTYFHRAGDKIEAYKSGETETPFDPEALN